MSTDEHTGAELEPGDRGQLRDHVDVPVVGLGCPVRSGVEDQVVGDVAQHGPQPPEGDLEGPAHGQQVGGGTVVEVGSVGPGDHQHLVG